MTDAYLELLQAKAPDTVESGFHVELDDLHPWLKPHCKAIVQWGLAGGCRAYFTNYGLHKTSMQLETGRQVLLWYERQGIVAEGLIVAPLGVRQEFFSDAEQLGIDLVFIRSDAEIQPGKLHITNYESVREGKITPALFKFCSLDEADVLRSYGSKTFQEFLPAFEPVPFKIVATATPSPNRYKELIHYAGFLGIMDTGQALTRWFQRNSEKANDLTLYPHKETEFWLWVASWAIFLQRPSDICGCSCHFDHSSPDSGSGVSLCGPGTAAPSETAHGSATAIAAGPTSPPPTISPPGGSSAAGASDQSTAERSSTDGSTGSGKACSHAAPGRATRTGKTTAGAESPSANVGGPSPTSSPTSESQKTGKPSTGSTTTSLTPLVTSDGRRASSRPVIDAQGRPLNYCAECRCDEGYELPELEIRWHEVRANLADAGEDSQGQYKLIRDAAVGIAEAAREKRDTLPARIAKMVELRQAEPENHFILWHDLEDERREIERLIPTAQSVYGTQDLEEREEIVSGFKAGTVTDLAAKPVMLAAGGNLQAHCHRAIFAGISHKARDIWQAWHRLQRFGQRFTVIIDMIYAETEREVRRDFEEKLARDQAMRARMSEIIRRFGLNKAASVKAMHRSIGVEREVATGAGWTAVHNDCVEEVRSMTDNSVGLIVTSVPFGTQYEYCESYNDFGHNDDNAGFFRQMDYLTPGLFRILQPGRVLAVHVKDRILFGAVTKLGFPSVDPFHADCIAHYRKHGFALLAVRPIETDVVRENNQTYRLGYSKMLKDATVMGAGSPEYVLFFRKPQTDRQRGWADDRVTKDPGEYSLARWQIDAAAYWRSDGNRLLTAEELAALPPKSLSKAFREQSAAAVYDHEEHVRLAETLADRNALPKTFAALSLQSPTGTVWTDILRMDTLNAEQAAKGREKHVCPLQIDVVDRVIRLYSNKGDLVFDPFGGLMTVPVRALALGRQGYGVDLNRDYWRDGVRFLRTAEAEAAVPMLFDLPDVGAAA